MPLDRLGTVYSQGDRLHWEESVTTFWCDPRGPPSPPEPNVSSGSHSILYLVIEDPPSAGGAFHSTLFGKTTRGVNENSLHWTTFVVELLPSPSRAS